MNGRDGGGPQSRFVFILSDMRSGSTLLDQLLGAHPLIQSAGELHWLAAYATQDRTQYDPAHELNCTCGFSVPRCPFWMAVEAEMGRPLSTLRLRAELPGLQKRLLDRFPGLFRRRWLQKWLAGARLAEDSIALNEHLLDVSGRLHLVDSSKSTLRFRAIHDTRPASTRGIILKRDCRAIVHSKMKRGHSLTSAAIGWRNKMQQIAALTADLPADHLHVLSYESLCQEPEQELRRLCTYLDVDFDGSMLIRPATVGHHIGGSPSQFDPSKSAIVLDTSYLHAFDSVQLDQIAQIVGDVPERWGY
jgi:hypothetical protein